MPAPERIDLTDLERRARAGHVGAKAKQMRVMLALIRRIHDLQATLESAEEWLGAAGDGIGAKRARTTLDEGVVLR